MSGRIKTLLPCLAALMTLSAAGATTQEINHQKTGNVTQKKPLRVFILAGQSNMQGHAKLSTFDVIGLDPKTAPMLREMRNADGTPRVCENVWISSIGCSEHEQTGRMTTGFGAEQAGPKIGPEFTFGIYMQKLIDEPILIIKTSWGGKSLHTDFRPPSAGPYLFRDEDLNKYKAEDKDVEQIKADKILATGRYYRLMIDHVKNVLADVKRVCPDYDPHQGIELAGFVWFQGWNDMVDQQAYPDRASPGGYDAYSEVLAHLIRDVRTDLAAPDLPVVIGVMGAGGPVEKYGPEKQRYAEVHRRFRQAMAAPANLPEFKGNVSAVMTENFWDMELESLRVREQQLRSSVKELKEQGKLDVQNEKTVLEQHKIESFTERELEILEKGASNQEYHYLGSAKIIGQIGKAFSESLFELIEQDDADELPDPDGNPADQTLPVKVFILMGQSNMLGFGRVSPQEQQGTLEHLTKTEGKYPHLVDGEGNWTIRNDVHYIQTTVGNRQHALTVKGPHIGTELQFGHIMGHALDEPVVILKACIGNRSLGWDLLPPGSEQFEFEEKIYAGYKDTPLSWVEGQPKEKVDWYAGKQYDTDVGNAKEILANLSKYYPDYKGQGYEVAGFVWWQGHKDQNAAHASRYEQNLVRLIKTLRKEFDAPKAPFVLATIAFGGDQLSGHGLTVANAQLAVSGDSGRYPEFAGNVTTIEARHFWKDQSVSPSGAGHHYNHNAETYMEVGNSLGRAMEKMLKEKQ